MPIQLQEKKIREWINANTEISDDEVDVEAELDSTLTYSENLNQIKSKLLCSPIQENEKYEELQKEFRNSNAQKGLVFDKLFQEDRVIGVVGGRNTAKSSFVLSQLLQLRKKYPKVQIYTLGVEKSLYKMLEENDIHIIHDKLDVLDLKINNSVIFIDEFADLFSVLSRNKQFGKIRKFFNRLAHLNDFVVLSTAQDKFWNSFMCGIVKQFIVKKVEFNSLVNGTNLKERVKALELTSEYRLDIDKNEYYVLTPNNLSQKGTFGYNPLVDSKSHLINPFKRGNK